MPRLDLGIRGPSSHVWPCPNAAPASRPPVERDYPHQAAKVFAAFAVLELKQHWFGGEESAADLREFDFRVGGRELLDKLGEWLAA
jgi:hypothetical protein